MQGACRLPRRGDGPTKRWHDAQTSTCSTVFSWAFARALIGNRWSGSVSTQSVHMRSVLSGLAGFDGLARSCRGRRRRSTAPTRALTASRLPPTPMTGRVAHFAQRYRYQVWITSATSQDAIVVDQYVANTTRLDPTTKDALDAAPTVEQYSDTFRLQNIDGTWKVVREDAGGQ